MRWWWYYERASGAIINSFDQIEQVIDDCVNEVKRYNQSKTE
ncbi:hypothetical protein [Mycoplasmopsis cynos]